MANYAALKATIDANIRANGNEEITGPVLNGVLTNILAVMGQAGYLFKGMAHPGDTPAASDSNLFYLAVEAGQYSGFDGRTVTAGQLAIFAWDGAWASDVLLDISGKANKNGDPAEAFTVFTLTAISNIVGAAVTGETVGADKVILHNPDNNAMTDIVPGGQSEDIEVAMPSKDGTLALQEDVDEAVGQLGQKLGRVVIPITEEGKYIPTNAGIGNQIGAITTDASYSYSKYPVSEGDFVEVNGTGGEAPRLWAFVDNTDKIIDASSANIAETGFVLTAPTNAAYVIINDSSNSQSFYTSKDSAGFKIDNLDKTVFGGSFIGSKYKGFRISTTSGTWNSDNYASYYLIAVTPGSSIKIKANSTYGEQVAILNSYITPTNNTSPDYAMGWTKPVSVAANTTQSYTVPLGAAYFYFLASRSNASTNTFPAELEIDGLDYLNRKTLQKQILQKQDSLEADVNMDSLPISGGTKPITSGGVFDYVQKGNNLSYPSKFGRTLSIASNGSVFPITCVELIKKHTYNVTVIADETFTAPAGLNLKIATADSDVEVYRIMELGGDSISKVTTSFTWENSDVENNRIGFYASALVSVPLSIFIEDITIDEVGISWDVVNRNKHKEAALVSVASRKGNESIKVSGKLTLLHFSDVHGNTANIGDVVEYKTHYADYLDDTIHTGDSVANYYTDVNPFESVDGADSILNAIGNHEAWLQSSDPDYYATEKQTYDKIFAPDIANWDVVQPTGAAENGYCYYYKDYTPAGFRLIVLDSVHWHYRNGVTESNPAQKAWFESVLADAKTNNLRVVCAMHYPPQNGILPVANDTGWNAPILPGTGGLVGDGWYAADEIFDCVDDFITAGGKFHGWLIGHTHEDFFGKVLGHTAQPIVVIGTANGSGYIYDKFITETVAQDNFNIITFENLNSKDYIKVVKMGGDCDVLMRSKKTICYNVTDGILIATT